MENLTTQDVTTLKEKVQNFREKARNILRMIEINGLLKTKFNLEKNVERQERKVKASEERLKIAEYKLNKLDQEDPRYETQKEMAEEYRLEETHNVEKDKKELEELIQRTNKNVEKINKEIEKYETGENKISIDQVDELTERMIMKI